MKKTLFLLLFAIGNLQAQIVRITAGTNLQAAIDNATAGTTFLVEGGTYGNITVSKRVALIGTGYLLGTNGTNTQANANTASLGNIFFDNPSANSLITGFSIYSVTVNSTANITLQRNLILTSLTLNFADNAIVKQNFLLTASVSVSNSSGFVFKSNIIGAGILHSNSASALGASGTFINNTFNSSYTMCEPNDSLNTTGNSFQFATSTNIIKNNLFIGKVYNSSCNSTSSLINLNGFASFDFNVVGGVTNANNSNTITTNFTNMFVGYPNNPNGLPMDARFQLPTNSPAKGAGENSTDAGAFGGDEPYVLSGIPVGPVVYELQVPTSTAVGQTIQVQIRAKIQN